MFYKKNQIFRWNTIQSKPVKGKLLLIKYEECGKLDFRFAIFSFKNDNEFYQVVPDDPIQCPIKLNKYGVTLWGYLPEVK